MPTRIDPMLATMGAMPSDQNQWAFEFKWDGVRALGFFSADGFHLLARSGADITARYPELKGLANQIDGRSMILDGEIVSLNAEGRPDFGKLQHRMHLHDAAAVARLSKSEPVFYVLFDVLYANGKSVMDQPYTARRALLESLGLTGDCWQITPSQIGNGAAMLATARQNHLEGLVAKKVDSIYRPGVRSPDWLKIKIIQRQEFVLAGWIPERTGLANRIGALLVGYYDDQKNLRFAGKVGTGLSAKDHAPLLAKLSKHPSKQSPFKERLASTALFTSRPLVAEIEYRRWRIGGSLQQAAFKGLRDDKKPRDVVRETLI
jgi:bifunctional non-homologous end joining protein LigD